MKISIAIIARNRPLRPRLAIAEFGRFGILTDGRPIRLGGGAFDGLTALIEASGAVISEDEL